MDVLAVNLELLVATPHCSQVSRLPCKATAAGSQTAQGLAMPSTLLLQLTHN